MALARALSLPANIPMRSLLGKRGDWLAWYIGRLARGTRDGSPEHRLATLIACLCARTAPGLSTENLRAIDMTEAWARDGEDNRKEARRITFAAYAAYYAVAISTAVAAAADVAYAAAADTYADQHFAAMADLIRAAVPVCPMPAETP